MEIIDNRNKKLKDDLASELKSGSKMSVAAACFSIYAFQELKKELKTLTNAVSFSPLHPSRQKTLPRKSVSFLSLV